MHSKKKLLQALSALALVEGGYLVPADELPSQFLLAASDVAADLGLHPDWINPGPAGLLEFGLPNGFLERCETITLAGLTVRIADRFDQIHFKLYAAADQGPRSKHLTDLMNLDPTDDELHTASQWCRTHDPSVGFAESVSAVIRHLDSQGGSDAS